MAEKKVQIYKGKKVARGVENKMRKKSGGGSVGKYKHVAKKKFAGPAGGAPEGSFPIPDLAHARNALARAHFAPNPEALKAKVYRMYPELKKRHELREEGHKPKAVGGSKKSNMAISKRERMLKARREK